MLLVRAPEERKGTQQVRGFDSVAIGVADLNTNLMRPLTGSPKRWTEAELHGTARSSRTKTLSYRGPNVQGGPMVVSLRDSSLSGSPRPRPRARVSVTFCDFPTGGGTLNA